MCKKLTYFVLFVLALAPSAGAAQYYVTPDGSDADPGTNEQPWKTLAMANRTVEPGDTVFIRCGEYREQLRPERSGEPGKYITYRAAAGETPVITDFYPGNQAQRPRATRDAIHYVPLPPCAYLTYINFGFVWLCFE